MLLLQHIVVQISLNKESKNYVVLEQCVVIIPLKV